MSEQSEAKYVVVVRAIDVANQGIGEVQHVWSADSLPLAVVVAHEYINEYANMSGPTFFDDELLSVCMMRADQWSGRINMRAEESGFAEDLADKIAHDDE